MVEKKDEILFFGILIGAIILILPMIVALNVDYGLTANGNYSGSVEVSITVANKEINATNITCYYNSSGGNAVNLADWSNVLGNLYNSTNFNTTSNDTVFTGTFDLSTLPDSGTYNISCNVTNVTGAALTEYTTNSSLYNITIDNTYPQIALGDGTTGTATNLTNSSFDWIYINVSASDINAENITWTLWTATAEVRVNHTTNATQVFNWTGATYSGTALGDAIYYYNATVCDYASNCNTTITRVITIDRTAPTISYTCTPSTLTRGSSVTCLCEATDATSGVASISANYTFTAYSTGTFTVSDRCSATDYAGNSNNATDSYTASSSSAASSSSSATTWTNTFVPSTEQFEIGYQNELKAKERVKVQIGNTYHHVGIKSLTISSATIEIASEPVQVTLDIGEDAKIDIDTDGTYDIYVKLNAITNSKADVIVKTISEEIPEGEGAVSTTREVQGEIGSEETGKEAESNLTWLWIVIGVIVVIAIIAGISNKRKR